jgi:hypothetical protein
LRNAGLDERIVIDYAGIAKKNAQRYYPDEEGFHSFLTLIKIGPFRGGVRA